MIRKVFFNLFLFICLVFIWQCTHTLAYTPVQITPAPDQMGNKVLLVIPEKTKNYIYQKRIGTDKWELHVGQAIQYYAKAYLDHYFRNGEILSSLSETQSGHERVLEVNILDFKIKAGLFTFSENTAFITIEAKILDSQFKMIWQKQIELDSTAKVGAADVVGQLLAGTGSLQAYNNNMAEAMNKVILISLKEVFVELKKSLNLP